MSIYIDSRPLVINVLRVQSRTLKERIFTRWKLRVLTLQGRRVRAINLKMCTEWRFTVTRYRAFALFGRFLARWLNVTTNGRHYDQYLNNVNLLLR